LTGEALIRAFGTETIERLQHYLDNRTFQPDAEPLSIPRTKEWKVTKKSVPTLSDPYQSVKQAAEYLGVYEKTLKIWMKELDIKPHRFVRDTRLFIARDDLLKIREIKRPMAMSPDQEVTQ
jgi:AraC-like DNA-binding protein